MAVTLPYIGLEEVTKDKTGLVKAAVAEFLGTMFLVNMVEKMTCPARYPCCIHTHDVIYNIYVELSTLF